MTAPEAGWYADPDDPSQLRLWDGASWTERTRPAFSTALERLPAEKPRTRQPSRRALVIGAVASALLVVALWVAVTRRSGSPSAASRHRPSTTATTVLAADSKVASSALTSCELPDSRPTPDQLIAWLNAHGVAATAASEPPRRPPGACGALAFQLAGSAALDHIFTFPSYDEAAKAARSLPPKSQVAFSASVYVIALDPSARAQEGALKSAMTQFVKFSDPLIPISQLIPGA